MDDQNQPGGSAPFVKKVVETPILDSSLREKISYSKTSSPGGFKGFYKSNMVYFWAIAVGLIIIGVLAYFAFKHPSVSAPKEANVSISVDAPATAPSGGEEVYKITVTNNDSQKLVNMELELNYPSGVTYVSSSPQATDLSGSLFAVPDLIPGQNAALFVKTKVTGNVNDTLTLDIKLHYHYSAFNSEFIKEQTSTITLSASDVVIELDGPASTNNAQLVQYTVKYQNNSDADIQNARITMTYPDGFSFGQSTPPPDLGSDTWNIGTLAKGGAGQIQIQGSFASVNPGESKTAMAEFLVLGQDGNFFTQNSSSFTTNIASLPLLVSQELQPANTTNVINPGDNLNFAVHYQNNASTVASGVNIEVDLNTKVLDLSSLQAQGAQINNSSIIWNAAGVPQLAQLLPNQSGDLSFSVHVNNPAIKDSSKNLTVVSNIKIQANEYQTAFPGNQLTLKLSSPSSVNTDLTYVSGQLPPQVGKQTVYEVKFSLTNSSNDFASGLLTAFLPAGGFSNTSVTPAESPNVQFDPTTGKLTWTVGSLPANAGRFSQPKDLEFQITLSPSSSEAGQSPTLVKTINFTATDLFTSQNVSVNSDDINTSDLQGQNGFSQGQVQP